MNWSSITSVLKGAAVAVLGATAVYVTQYVTGHDFGSYALLVGAVASTVVNIIRMLIVDLGGTDPGPNPKTKH